MLCTSGWNEARAGKGKQCGGTEEIAETVCRGDRVKRLQGAGGPRLQGGRQVVGRDFAEQMAENKLFGSKL